jgi:cytochrome c
MIVRQSPGLLGVDGRQAGTGEGFNDTKALSTSCLNWDAHKLDRFLKSPVIVVPGTPVPVPVNNAHPVWER